MDGWSRSVASANMSCMSSTLDLTGRVALVTGGARRIGAALVRGFHAAGANVVIHCHRSTREAEQLRAELDAKRGRSAVVAAADLLDERTTLGIIESAISAFGRLDILINNASTFYPTPFGQITSEHWNDLVGTNLRAPLFVSQAAVPHLRQARGLILNMIDIHAQRPLPHYPVYSTAKAGLAMLTRALARELGPDIRVNGIAPGPILWPDAGAEPQLQAEIVSKTLLKRTGSPDDIVRTALFLAREASYITGQIIAVDGGRSVGW
jgi:pteridine reductase